MDDSKILDAYNERPKSSKWLMLIELRRSIQIKKEENTSLSIEKATYLTNMEQEIIESMTKGGKNYFFSNDYHLYTKAATLLDYSPILVQQQLVLEAEERKHQQLLQTESYVDNI